MAVWSMVDGVLKKHAERKPMLSAGIRVSVAVTCGVPIKNCAVYRRDPAKNPDEPNILPELAAKAERATKRKRR